MTDAQPAPNAGQGEVLLAGLFVDLAGEAMPGSVDRIRTSGWSAVGMGGADYIHDAAVDAAYVAANPRSSAIMKNGRGFRYADDQTRQPMQFGAVGDDVTDDREALVACYRQGGLIVFPSAARFRVHGTIPMVSGTTVRGNGSWIRQTADQARMFAIDGLRDIAVSGLNAQGKRSDYINSSSSEACCYRGDRASNVTIEHCQFRWFAYSPVFADLADSFTYRHCTVEGPDLVSAGGPLGPLTKDCTGGTIGGRNIDISYVDVSRTAQGLIVVQGTDGFSVANCTAHDIVVEHGLYVDAGVCRGSVLNNTFRRCRRNGMKYQWYDGFGGVPEDVTFAFNLVEDCGGDGFLAENTGGTIRAKGLKVYGNAFRRCGQTNINIRWADAPRIEWNECDGARRHNIECINTVNPVFQYNDLLNADNNAFFGGVGNSGGELIGGTIRNPGQASDDANGASSAIFLASGAWKISGLDAQGDQKKTQYMLYLAGADVQRTEISGTRLLGARDFAVRGITGAFKRWRDNTVGGARGVTFNGLRPMSRE